MLFNVLSYVVADLHQYIYLYIKNWTTILKNEYSSCSPTSRVHRDLRWFCFQATARSNLHVLIFISGGRWESADLRHGHAVGLVGEVAPYARFDGQTTGSSSWSCRRMFLRLPECNGRVIELVKRTFFGVSVKNNHFIQQTKSTRWMLITCYFYGCRHFKLFEH